uniref:DNA-directed RNA polymerase subunit beta'' n=1 Tax=Coscinodiscus granii TaxID=265552 RepID=A0A8A6KN93_9STRA|nr:RNA polymerase b''-subunit [Coscinodiscus granii]QTI83005.1 RNA polymerase b''-subunit [Coscinodiscus granii]
MKTYTYQNTIISKKQLKQLLSWSFTEYGSIKAGFLANNLKYLGFKYATKAGISISIEDLKVPKVKNSVLQNANQEILNAEKVYLKGKITEVERFQKIIDTWNITSELLKDEVVSYFKKYDPLNSVYIMAFSGARGNLSQVRQLVGMRGLMSDPNGEIMNLPIKKNFREGLTITDYLMSGYGARKGIVDTALKTANSGYLTRRLIDVAQDIIIREKDCLTTHSFFFGKSFYRKFDNYENLIGRLLNKPIYHPQTNELIANTNTHITPKLIRTFKEEKIEKFYIRSPLTCGLFRSICQKCYGWDLATENLINMGEAIGIIAGQSIGEPGTQLTMRTFHTGGIFTSETNQQLNSPITGTIEFSKILKTSKLRTNRGENVLLTESSGSLTIMPQQKNQKKIQLELPRNTILFIKNFQFVQKDTLIGQLAGTLKQTRTETKHIVSDVSGEIFMPKIKSKINSTIQNKLLWILAGQVYQAPDASFLNLFADYKINKNSFIFRSKLINPYPGLVKINKNQKNLFQQGLEIKNDVFYLKNVHIKKLSSSISFKNYVLTFKNLKYLLDVKLHDNEHLKTKLLNKNFGTLLSNSFLTLTGGTPFYNVKLTRKKSLRFHNSLAYLNNLHKKHTRSLVWLEEETHQINADKNFLLIQNGDWISEKTELLPNIFSKISGIVNIIQKKNNQQEIIIKSGLLYQNLNISNFTNQIFYPGEIIFNKIEINQLSFCEIFKHGLEFHLLIRPLEIYEIPLIKSLNKHFKTISQKNSGIILNNDIKYFYSSGQKIRKSSTLELLTRNLTINSLRLKTFNKKSELNLDLLIEKNRDHLTFITIEKLNWTNYIPADLKYTSIQACLLVEDTQFMDSYTICGYLESVTTKSLELVKIKSKLKKNKQVFLISNNDCFTIKKSRIKKKMLNNLIVNDLHINKTGKILIDNGKTLTLQKGQPYFFPNCTNENFSHEIDLKYRWIPSRTSSSFNDSFSKNKFTNINYYDITSRIPYKIPRLNFYEKISIPRLMLKKRGKTYSSSIPIFVREFLISKQKRKNSFLSKLDITPWYGYLDFKDKIYKTKKREILPSLNRIRFDNIYTIFMKSSEFISNDLKSSEKSPLEFASVSLLEYPFKTIGIHSITEDYFEQEVNSVYCNNGEFIEKGEILGLLNFEKEITGDIVQGLPRVEELLEARKKKRVSKHTAKNHKKSLLIRKTTVDTSFEFRKLGTTVKENEKINPHSLLKIYFNYYAETKYLICQEKNRVKLCKLSNNYEASYRSFKKIQALILNSVQSVYKSQGVNIADKHLEVIIKQMTTKVLITHEGETPLLPREVIDLYHIRYINQVVKLQQKAEAYYVPLLLGITKGALNNPSFISAASFQETTRVLTKAAIEGRLDWLRGLKENIIIGHLIPAGTGCKNFVNLFQKEKIMQPSLTIK